MIDDAETKMRTEAALLFELKTSVPFYHALQICGLIYVDIYLAIGPLIMSGILTQTVGQCKMQIWRHPENSNQTTDVFTFHLLKLGSAFAPLLSRSSIMTVGTSSNKLPALDMRSVTVRV
jgi:hypothetical protein